MVKTQIQVLFSFLNEFAITVAFCDPPLSLIDECFKSSVCANFPLDLRKVRY